MEIFFVWLLFAAGVGYLASTRGRSGGGFFLLSVVASPLLGLIVVLVMKNLVDVADKEHEQRKEHERQLESIRAIAVSASGGRAGAEPAGPAVSVADELMKLSTLRDKGVLSDDEFQAQKAVLLKRPPAPAAPQPAPSPAPPVPQGVCPNCEATIPARSAECPKCKASFGVGSAWTIKPLA